MINPESGDPHGLLSNKAVPLLKRLYVWVLSWADTPYGVPVLVVLAFAEASFFPIPPDILLIALCLARPRYAMRYALAATIGSVCGGVLGYGIGFGVWTIAADWFYAYVPGFTPELFNRVGDLFARYDFWTVFAAGFTPIPYKVFTISAGAFGVNLPIFVFASLVSRALRFYLVAGLLRLYGDRARIFIERYFNLLTIFALLLVVVILVIWSFIPHN